MERVPVPEVATTECVLPARMLQQPPEEGLAEAAADEEEDAFSIQARSYILYIGNLNPKFSREVLCSMLKDLLGTASITLPRHSIEVVKKRRQAHAFVQVTTVVSLEHILKQLLLASEAEHNLVSELVKKGKNLVMGKGKRFAFGAKDGRESDSVGSSSENLARLPLSKKTKVNLSNELQSSSRSAQHPWRLKDWPRVSLSGTRSDSAIVQKEIVGQERLFYGASMGCETRNVEFKRGGGEYLTVTLKHHVRKYMCAFLNSEGGSLFVGVEDSGFVHGVRCNHKDEDRVRLLVDTILKGFKPQVFPAAYSLSFIPVIRAEDTGIFLKVIRLSVHPPKQHGEPLLYETDQGEVYLRRDGSIQGPLCGSAIQEWCRQKWTGEIKKLEEKLERLLKEKETLQQHVQQKSRCCVIL